MKAIEGDKLRGHLETLVLSVLERGRPTAWKSCDAWKRLAAGCYGSRKDRSTRRLYRLEAAGKVEAIWEAESHGRRGARRRIYRLTPKGKRELAKGREEWVSFVQIIGGIVGAPA